MFRWNVSLRNIREIFMDLYKIPQIFKTIENNKGKN